MVVTFLGGLSLHLNHLIVERVSAPYRQFGTLPIGIFLSNLVSGQLETSLMTSCCHFWNLSTLATPGLFEYFGQNWVSSENQSFLDEGVTGLRCDLGVLVARSLGYMMVPFLGGCDALKGVSWAVEKTETEKLDFQHICDGLKGIRHLLISSRISP